MSFLSRQNEFSQKGQRFETGDRQGKVPLGYRKGLVLLGILASLIFARIQFPTLVLPYGFDWWRLAGLACVVASTLTLLALLLRPKDPQTVPFSERAFGLQIFLVTSGLVCLGAVSAFLGLPGTRWMAGGTGALLAVFCLTMAHELSGKHPDLALGLGTLGAVWPLTTIALYTMGWGSVAGIMQLSDAVLILPLFLGFALLQQRHPVLHVLLARRKSGRLLRAQFLVWLLVTASAPLVVLAAGTEPVRLLPHLFAFQSWLIMVASVAAGLRYNAMVRQGRVTERRLQRALNRDLLTGMATRRAVLETVLPGREGERIGLILFDIDHFKKVNDRFGHNVGDRVLQSAARAVQDEMRIEGHIARWGGEEFLVIADVDTPEALLDLAEHLRRSFAPVARSAGLDKSRVTASFGCSMCRYNGKTSFDKALKQADLALYRAKTNGRNRVELSENTKDSLSWRKLAKA